MSVNRQAIIDGILSDIRAEMPEELIGTYQDMKSQMAVETLSTGSFAVDLAIGGGFAKGRLINLVGHSSSGKTTLALTAVATMQKEKSESIILYVDAENALDLNYAEALGVNIDKLYMIQPNNGENGYEVAHKFVASGVCDLVIIDSIAAMVPQQLLETDLGDQAQIGVGARLDSQGIGRIFAAANKTKTTVIMINQWKKATRINQFERTDGLSGHMYQSGGQSLPFYMTQMIEVQRIAKQSVGDDFTADQIRARAFKNKISAPYREADFYITYGEGVDKAQEAMDFGLQEGLVIKTGRSVFSLADNEDIRGNGRQKFVDALKANPEELDKLISVIKERLEASNRRDFKIDREANQEPEVKETDTSK